MKKTGRTAPLMDGFDFHPYPVPQSLPFAKGYGDERSASVSNLPRIYQAFYAAFNGTPQRTIGQHTGGGLPVSLNETGVQTDVDRQERLHRAARSARRRPAASSASSRPRSSRRRWYRQMLDLVACDPNVDVVNIFHLIDETNLAGLAERALLRRPDAEALGRGRARLDREDRRRLRGQGDAWTPAAAAGGRCGRRREGGKPTVRRRKVKPTAKPKTEDEGEAKAKPTKASKSQEVDDPRHLTGRTRVRYADEQMFAKLFALALSRSSSGRSRRGHRAPTARRRVYRVQPYDTLWTIASSHYGGDVREAIWRIQQANHLPDATIHPGERLVLP